MPRRGFALRWTRLYCRGRPPWVKFRPAPWVAMQPYFYHDVPTTVADWQQGYNAAQLAMPRAIAGIADV